jgi:cell division septation protein DedD
MTSTGRRAIFLIALAVVVVLALPARKAIDYKDDDEHGKPRDFPESRSWSSSCSGEESNHRGRGNPSLDGASPSPPPGGRAKIALLDLATVF